MLYLYAREDLLKETSIYTTSLSLRDIWESQSLSKIDESNVRIQVCGKDEPMCKDKSVDTEGPFCFIYDKFL